MYDEVQCGETVDMSRIVFPIDVVGVLVSAIGVSVVCWPGVS